MKSFDQFNYSNLDLPESENLDEESLEELFGQIRKAGKLISRMARSSNSGGQGTGTKQLELPLGNKDTKGKLSPIPKGSSVQPKPGLPKVGKNVKQLGNFLTKPGVRMAGSIINQGAKAFKREFAAQPKISSTAPGTGFGAPFGGVMGAAGAGIKGAVTKGQTFDKNTTDKDGNVQLGKKAGSILSRARSSASRNLFGATPVRDQNKEKKDGKVPVTTDAERKKPRSQTPASAAATRSNKSKPTQKTQQMSIDSAALRNYNRKEKTPGTQEYEAAQRMKREEDKFPKGSVKAGQESETTGAIVKRGEASPEAKKNFEKVMSNARKLPGSSPNQPRLTGSSKQDDENEKRLGKSALKFAKMAPKADAAFRDTAVKMNQNQKQSIDLLKKAFTKQKREDDKNSNNSTQQGPKMLRPNISNQKYRNNPELYKQDKEAYDAQSAEFKTKRGGGRPTKLDQARKSGAMAAAQKKNPIRIKRGTKEVMQDQYSWREEFIWETEKMPSKKKDGRGMHPHGEIKPMSGKNNVTINPEDQSAKYKRGY